MASSKFIVSVLAALAVVNSASLEDSIASRQSAVSDPNVQAIAADNLINALLQRDLNDPNAIPDGVKSAMVNIHQTVDSLTQLTKEGNQHPTANAIGALVTGIDSQADNAGAVLAEVTNPVTFGISNAIGDFALGPFFQASTNGAEVVVSNVIGAPVDFIAAPVLHHFSNSLSVLVAQGNKYKQDTVRLQFLSNVLNEHLVKIDAAPKNKGTTPPKKADAPKKVDAPKNKGNAPPKNKVDAHKNH